MSKVATVESWLRRVNPRIVDVTVSMALALVVIGDQVADKHFSPVTLIAGIVVAASVAVRRQAPLAAVMLALAGATVMSHYRVGGSVVSPVALALTYYTAGRRGAERGWSWIDFAVLALPLPGIATDPSTPSPGNPLILDLLSVWAFFLLIPFAAGRAVGTRMLVNSALRINAQRLEEEQREQARRAVAHERARIARELHDVVAHSVCVMVIQTAAARRVAGHDRRAAADALGAVETCGRDALIDMRRMIGVMRRGDLDLLGGAAPGLAQIGKLVERARTSGLSVVVDVEGDVRALPVSLDLVVFRVVQEALTNAIKYASPAHVRVRVRFTVDSLELEILDTGRSLAANRSTPAKSVGHGLIGMQERLSLYGGQLRTGRRLGGGFQIHARIPLPDPAVA